MKIMKNNNGFTLIEVVVVAGILAFAIVSMLQLFIYTSVQSEMAGNKTVAISEAQEKIEEIRRHDFNNIAADYAPGGTPGDNFALAQLNGMGKVYITDVGAVNNELLQVKVVISWLDKYGRTIGEDANIDGVFNVATEDSDGNGIYDSPANLESMITRR